MIFVTEASFEHMKSFIMILTELVLGQFQCIELFSFIRKLKSSVSQKAKLASRLSFKIGNDHLVFQPPAEPAMGAPPGDFFIANPNVVKSKRQKNCFIFILSPRLVDSKYNQ